MKKILTGLIVIVNLTSCSKRQESKNDTSKVYYFTAQAVSIDGTINTSNTIILTQ